MWVATAASSANSMYLMRSLRTFVLALRRARLKSLSSERVRKQIPSVVVSKICFSNRPKKVPKRIGARTQPFFDETADFECLREAVIDLHCSLRVNMERLDHALQFGWATDLWENLKEAVSAD